MICLFKTLSYQHTADWCQVQSIGHVDGLLSSSFSLVCADLWPNGRHKMIQVWDDMQIRWLYSHGH